MGEKIKICAICKQIILPKENYVRITDYQAGIFYMENFYHNNCYREKLKGGQDLSLMKKQTFQLLKKARQMLGMDEVVQV